MIESAGFVKYLSYKSKSANLNIMGCIKTRRPSDSEESMYPSRV